MPRRMTEEEWRAFDALTEEEIRARALSDPDCPPDVEGHRFRLREEDGATPMERLIKAVERERAAGRMPPAAAGNAVGWK